MGGAYRRPRGVTILALLTAISAVTIGLAGVLLVLAGLREGAEPLRLTAAVAVITGFIALAVVVGYGFVEIRPWGWPVGLAYVAVDAVWRLVDANGDLSVPAVAGIAVDVAVLVYLLRPSTRKAFVGWATV